MSSTVVSETASDAPPMRQRREAFLWLLNPRLAIGLFIIAVVVVTLSDQSTRFTVACAWLYVAARLLYIPAYVQGWDLPRSLIWGAGFVATLLMILSAFV